MSLDRAVTVGISVNTRTGKDDSSYFPVICPDGCVLEGGSRNCTAACSNTSAVFSNMSSFQNCLASPVISALWENGSLSNNNQLVAGSYGIEATRHDTTISIQQCLAAYYNCWIYYLHGSLYSAYLTVLGLALINIINPLFWLILWIYCGSAITSFST